MPPPRQLHNKANIMNHQQRRVIKRHVSQKNGSSEVHNGSQSNGRKASSNVKDNMGKRRHEGVGHKDKSHHGDDETETEDDEEVEVGYDNLAARRRRARNSVKEARGGSSSGENSDTSTEDDEGDEQEDADTSKRISKMKAKTSNETGATHQVCGSDLEPSATKHFVAARHINDGDDLEDEDGFENDDFDLDSSARGGAIVGIQQQHVQVGHRVAVYWSGDDEYYEGTVTRQGTNPQQKKRNSIYVEYDDGDSEWVDLKKATIRMVEKKRKNDKTKLGDDKSETHRNNSSKHKSGTTKSAARGANSESICDLLGSQGERKSCLLEEKTEQNSSLPPEPVAVNDIKQGDDATGVESLKVGDGKGETDCADVHGAIPQQRPEIPIADYEQASTHARTPRSTSAYDAKAMVNPNDNDVVEVGNRVAVYWSGDDEFYEGTVTRHHKKHRNRFFVKYDDNDCEWVDIKKRMVRRSGNNSATIKQGSVRVKAGRPNTRKEDKVNHNKRLGNVSELRDGARVSVWRSKRREYYKGTVAKISRLADFGPTSSSASGNNESHYIVYDDGDKEHTNLAHRKFIVLHGPNVDDIETRDRRTRAKNVVKRDGANDGTISHDEDRSNDSGNTSTSSDTASNSDDDASQRAVKCGGHTFKVGDRISVYWSGDDDYYEGRVTKQNRKQDRFYVSYDDGDQEWVDIKKRMVRTVGGKQGEEFPASASPAKKRRRKVNPDVTRVSVGSRVSVWWPAEKEYYESTVKRIKAGSSKPHRLRYDDGDYEKTNLAYRKFTLLS